jgi:DNA topoisomerase-3
LTGEWEFKLKQMERGQLPRETFMGEIRQLTTDLVSKVRGGMGQEVRGNFSALEVKCPKWVADLQGKLQGLRMRRL